MPLVAQPPPPLQLDPPDTNCQTAAHPLRSPEADTNAYSEVNWDEADSLSQVFRHSGWANDRSRVYAALKRTMQSVSRIINFSACGFASYVLKSEDDPPRYRIAGSKCHDRFCTPCSIERSRTITANVLDRLGKRTVRAMTLTIGGVGLPLLERLDHLDKSFQVLRRTPFWRRYITGGVAFVEVKWSPASERWHPHLHCLIEGKYIPKRQLSIEWQQVTGDSQIVRLSLVANRYAAIRETTKYASKPLNNTYLRIPERLDEAIHALYGRRLCTTFGRWRGVALTPHPPEDAWEHLGPLDDMIRSAAAGDVFAINVLAQLNVPAATAAIGIATARSPPPLVPHLPGLSDLPLPGLPVRHHDLIHK